MTVRLDEEELKRLKELADSENRSVNQQVVFLIHQAIENQESKSTTA